MSGIAGRLAKLGVFFWVVAHPAYADVHPGDCVIYREGGEGRIFRSPTYWLRGKVAEVIWARRAGAGEGSSEGQGLQRGADDEMRLRLVVEAWETPWSIQHGKPGRLFRGQYAGRGLEAGGMVDIEAERLERCEDRH